jgi:DNA repair protein RadC
LGLVDASLIHCREAYRAAIRDGASSIVLIHNHPSNDPTPSAEDMRITRQLVEAGKILDIKVLDHVVIGRAVEPTDEQPGRPAFFSLRESGLCSFT